MATIDLLIEDPRWSAVDLDGLCKNACASVLQYLDLSAEFEISVLGCDDARIAVLNSEFREKAQPTNVLSWPTRTRGPLQAGDMPEPPDDSEPMQQELGDIAIAYETCQREAEAAELTIEDHATHLLVHATLHLLGFDHINDADAALMERQEVAILAKLGISDPYRG